MGSADEEKPSLEAPSLGSWRRRKRAANGEQPVVGAPAALREAAAPPDGGEQTAVEMPASADQAPRTPASGEQATVPDPPTVRDLPPVVAKPEPEPEPEAEREPEPEPEVERDPEPEPTVVQSVATLEPPPRPRPPRAPRLPLNGHLAATVAGVVVGAFLVLGTYGGLQACASVRGTTSCGGGPGFVLLALILVLAVVIGTVVLRAAKVASAGSISFLAVALVAVLSLLVLLDALDSVTGAVIAGVLTVGAYLLSHWVTVRFIDTVE